MNRPVVVDSGAMEEETITPPPAAGNDQFDDFDLGELDGMLDDYKTDQKNAK